MLDVIYVAKLYKDARLPTRKYPEDAGMDLYAHLEDSREHIFIAPNTMMIIGTGVRVIIPQGYAGLVWAKGGSNHLIGAGVVDSGYVGEILVKVTNITNEPYIIRNGSPIAQLLIQAVETPEIKEMPDVEYTFKEGERGITGGIVNQNNGLD